MIRVDTSGIDAFCQQANLGLAEMDRYLTDRFVQWTHKLFKELVMNTPQWSGDLTANWNYSVGYPDFNYAQVPNKQGDDFSIDHWVDNQGVYQRGHPRAVNMALGGMRAGSLPTWRDKVYFANATPIAESVEAEEIKIRPVNLVDGRVAMVQYMATKYKAKS